jgi:hypothetical protein
MTATIVLTVHGQQITVTLENDSLALLLDDIKHVQKELTPPQPPPKSLPQ